MSTEHKLNWILVSILSISLGVFVGLLGRSINNNVVYTALDVKSSESGLNYLTIDKTTKRLTGSLPLQKTINSAQLYKVSVNIEMTPLEILRTEVSNLSVK